MPVIIVGSYNGVSVFGAINTDAGLHKYDSAGNIYPHGHQTQINGNLYEINGVALDSSGGQYAAGRAYAYSDATVHAFYGAPVYTTCGTTPDGDIRWTANHQACVWGLAIDQANGRLYTVGQAVNAAGTLYPDSPWAGGGLTGDRTGYVTTRAYDLDGDLLWSADHGFCYTTTQMRVVYRNGYVYTVGEGRTTGDGGGNGGNLTKYNASTGSVVWSAAPAPNIAGYYQILSVSVDASDAVYLVGLFTVIVSGVSTHCSILKYDSDGVLAASVPALTNLGGTPIAGRGLVFTSTGDVILASSPVLYDSTYGYYKTLHRYDASLSFITSNAGHLSWPALSHTLTIDAEDRLYFLTGRSTTGSGSCLRRVGLDVFTTNTLSDWDWSANLLDNSSEFIDGYCVAVSAVETPPLRILAFLATPTWQGDYYSAIPALMMPLVIGLPYRIREYVGLPQPSIYRLFLTGTPALELPLSSFSVRTTVDGIAISCVSPGATLATVDAIESRDAGELVLYRGIRWSSGIEQLDELARASLDGIRYDLGSRSGSITLEGSSAVTISHTQTRVLRGISYRAESGGVRRVRCDVDTYIRPGDTADLGGGETLPVSSITISVSSASAVMEIAE